EKSAVKDFTNREEAIQWISEEIREKPWEDDSLSSSTKESLQNATKNPSTRFTKLDMWNEAIENLRSEEKIKASNNSRLILPIDAAIAKNKGLSESIYAHVNMTDLEIGDGKVTDSFATTWNNTSQYYQNGKVDVERVKALKQSFQYGIVKGFLCGKLLPEASTPNKVIRLKLEIPKGTRVCYWTDDSILVERNKGIEIQDITVIEDEKTNPFIEIKGKLVNREELEQKIKQAEIDINKKHFPAFSKENKQIIKFDLSSLYASRAVAMADECIAILKNNIPENILTACFQKMNSEGAIYFSDQDLKNVVRADDKSTLLGRLDGFQKVLYTTCRGQFTKGLKGQQTDLLGTLIHEFGHACDFILFNGETSNVPFQRLYINKWIEGLGENGFHVEEFLKAFQTIQTKDLQDAQKETRPAEKYLRTMQANLINLKKIPLIAQNLKLDLKTLQTEMGKIQRQSFTQYATVNAWEYFAELFRALYGGDSNSKERVMEEEAKAVQFIKKLIENYHE
ncbi:hypothetical protein ACLBXI_28875, partial [Bacillus cereus]